MAQKEIVTLECDLCGTESPAEPVDGSDTQVKEHTISFDGRATRLVDACDGCWVSYREMLEKLMAAGRSAKRALNGRGRLARAS